MQQKDIELLLKKYHAGECSAEEVTFLESWYAQWNEKIPLKLTPDQLAEDLQIISDNIQPLHQEAKRVALWPRIAAAASILFILSFGGYYILHKPQPAQQIAQNQIIVPGSKKAVLTLSNGKQISLTDAHAGTIAQQGNTSVIKTTDGQVVYNEQSKTGNQEIIYNTITTPRGGFYPLKMADGTIVVLDAQSSIKYPVTFTGNERLVEITGQVYFEVTHNAAQPFKIRVKGQTIEDLGTIFNINAYDDEPFLRTTLINGSVRVTKETESVLLKPGEQAVTNLAKNSIHVQNVDTEDIIAWKNGQTSFKNEDITEIMRQVSRWYDVDVQFKGELSKRQFVGGLPRKADFADLVKILEFNNIHVTVEGKKLIVKP
jgi:transmembrane sensor